MLKSRKPRIFKSRLLYASIFSLAACITYALYSWPSRDNIQPCLFKEYRAVNNKAEDKISPPSSSPPAFDYESILLFNKFSENDRRKIEGDRSGIAYDHSVVKNGLKEVQGDRSGMNEDYTISKSDHVRYDIEKDHKKIFTTNFVTTETSNTLRTKNVQNFHEFAPEVNDHQESSHDVHIKQVHKLDKSQNLDKNIQSIPEFLAASNSNKKSVNNPCKHQNSFEARWFLLKSEIGRSVNLVVHVCCQILAKIVTLCSGIVDDRPAWVWTILCSMLVMASGIVPAFLIPDQKVLQGSCISHIPGSCINVVGLNRLLSFAVGSLLGDVFFHLLPESWNDVHSAIDVGMWVITGLLACILIEKFCANSESSQHYIAAIANLVANVMDNFTHGLAVGGSFLVSKRLGFLTTFAILIHEVPHEISDFAILLRADFDRIAAIKAQLITATGGLLGAAVAFMDGNAVERGASWILPFTAGGFLNIALVQVLPDIMKEKRFNESMKQLGLLVCGIVIMALLNSSSVHV